VTLIHPGDTLEQEVLDALAGGRTRSAVELVTDLAVPYDDVEQALTHLLSEKAIAEAYEAGGEVFYERAHG
jgi:hypothetical protein